jgi:hypothetical protein
MSQARGAGVSPSFTFGILVVAEDLAAGVIVLGLYSIPILSLSRVGLNDAIEID